MFLCTCRRVPSSPVDTRLWKCWVRGHTHISSFTNICQIVFPRWKTIPLLPHSSQCCGYQDIGKCLCQLDGYKVGISLFLYLFPRLQTTFWIDWVHNFRKMNKQLVKNIRGKNLLVILNTVYLFRSFCTCSHHIYLPAIISCHIVFSPFPRSEHRSLAVFKSWERALPSRHKSHRHPFDTSEWSQNSLLEDLYIMLQNINKKLTKHCLSLHVKHWFFNYFNLLVIWNSFDS